MKKTRTAPLTVNEKQRIVETMRSLLADDKLNRSRLAAADFVREKMKARLNERLGISDRLIAGFIATGAGEEELISIIKENGLLPDRQLRMFLSQIKPPKKDSTGKLTPAALRRSGIDIFYDHVLWKEGIALRKAARLDNKTWTAFINGLNHTAPATIEDIIRELELSEGEADTLRRLQLKSDFTVNAQLQKKVREDVAAFIKENSDTVDGFLLYSLVTEREWQKFGGEPDTKNTSQNTLLKLSAGFGHSLSQSKEFLDTAQSGFVFKSDLVFLTALICELFTPDEINMIFSEIFRDCTSPYGK